MLTRSWNKKNDYNQNQLYDVSKTEYIIHLDMALYDLMMAFGLILAEVV